MSRATFSLQHSPPGSAYGFRKCCEAIRAVVPIENVGRRYTKLRPLGGKAWFDGRCPRPDHEDKTPSFYIYPPGRFYCYGCNRGGDVVDLEFFCGDYGELWEAMVSLAVEYDVELPQRPASWFAMRERQQPVRGGIEAALIRAARRRLYKRYFEPIIAATVDPEDRVRDEQELWEATLPLAKHLVNAMMLRGR